MAAVTRERIELVHRDVTGAMVRTGAGTTLAAADQSRLLAQACAEVCELLTDWLASPHWTQWPRDGSTLVGAALDRQDYVRFLDQTLADVAGRAGLTRDTAKCLVDNARDAVASRASRRPPWRQHDLFEEADLRVQALRTEVCALAPVLAAPEGGPAQQRRARSLLRRALLVLPTIMLAMAATSPAQMQTNLGAWAHDTGRVVVTYLIGDQAHTRPHIVIDPHPPELAGPEIY